MLILGLILATAAFIGVWFIPTRPSMADEERELRAYFRRKDAAEARGERYPP